MVWSASVKCGWNCLEEGFMNEAETLECRICWYVYDAAEGDEMAQIPAGTAFADLPEDWRCPRCEAAKDCFLPCSL